jgi:hypothetical protein
MMVIAVDVLAGITELLSAPTVDRSVVPELRRRFPGLPVTICDRSDVDSETPHREFARVSLYLVDGRDHCWRLTAEPAHATGVAIAFNKGTP